MEQWQKIGFIGGDRRQIACAEELAGSGYETVFAGFENYAGDVGSGTKCGAFCDVCRMADVVVLPLPTTKDGTTVYAPYAGREIRLSDVLSQLSDCRCVLYATPCDALKPYIKNGKLHSYHTESVKLASAVPTAEGALALAVQNTERMLFGERVLVTGFGRIAEVLCRYLAALGAHVSVSSRRADHRAKARFSGYEPVACEEIARAAAKARIIFNTVPARIFPKETVAALAGGTVYVELASSPGGIDLAAAREQGVTVVDGGALPGRFSPVSAGEFLADGIRETLSVLAGEEAEI